MKIRIRIKEIDSKIDQVEPTKFPKINIKFLENRINGKEGEVDFEFKANYTEDEKNYIKMIGTAFIEDRDNEEKELNKEELTELTNAISYICGVNGVLVAKIYGIRSPLIPPRLGLK